MSDRAHHDAFVNALLLLEEGVGEEEYAAYRRRLAQRLVKPPLPRRTSMKAHWAAAALLLATGFAFHSLREARDAFSISAHPVLLSEQKTAAPGRSAGQEESLYAPVVQAGLVALVRTEEPYRQRGTNVFPLRIERVLKDETRQRPAQFTCAFKEETQAGQQYLACISQRGGQWVLNDMVRVDERARRSYLPGAERCVQLLAASRSGDPATQYESLLASSAGGMDEPASCVFSCKPDPRSSSALLGKLHSLHGRLQSGNFGDGRAALDAELGRVAEALERLNESAAAIPIAECTRLTPPGRRAVFYRVLPGLCASASPKVREQVRHLLEDELETPQAHPDDARAARSALMRTPFAR